MKALINYKTLLCLAGLIAISFLQSCSEDLLEEEPLADLNTLSVLKTRQGFENYIISLHKAARDEMTGQSDATNYFYIMYNGTDIASHGNNSINNTDYNNAFTPTVSTVRYVWDWAYLQMILRSSTVIFYAQMPELNDIWDNEEDKNAVIAEAKFFRAYTYNMLANLYGGVPLVDTVFTKPKTDFVRATRQEILEFARKDLEFASKWLPATVPAINDGRIVKAAADHLLTEVYISLEQYDKAVTSASSVINSGLYKLMTERFGTEKDKPGDVFSDLFRDGNQNRSAGNLESIYVWQFEDVVVGGQGATNGNNRLRKWGPWYERILDPDKKSGCVVVDSLGRGTGQVRPTNYFLQTIWMNDWDNDIRNSTYNIRRVFYYTNPKSKYFGKVIEPKKAEIDTMQYVYPYPRKIEGKIGTFTNVSTAWSGRTYQEFMVFRLAETYLLRAEAYYRLGNLTAAAEDINRVRSRAHAKLIQPAEVTIDYILDERARELIAEEPRRRTLVRLNLLVERVRKYNGREITRKSIQDYHRWWPIPQTAIDANFSVELEQNPGY